MDDSRILVRRLEKRDIPSISAIEAAAFSMPWSAEDFEKLLERDYCVYYVAEYDGIVVGSCGMTISFGEGSIDNVVVDENYRGKGIAHEMIRTLLKEGDAQGIEAYTLEVRVSNQAAIAVYTDEGFVSEGIRPRFYEKPVEDAMIMWRRKNQEA